MKTLKAGWTIKGMADVLSDDLAKKMSDSIDAEILIELLWKIHGWTKFTIPRYVDNHHAIDIGYWLLDNCQGEYKRNGRTFLFKDSKDATMFILRWGS